MPTLLQIAQLGHPILRKKAKPVTDFSDQDVQKLIDDLIATVKEVNGVGISAPQAYQSLRIFIVASYPNARYPHAPKMKPTAIINPQILSFSKNKTKDWEGCLSIPEIRGLIPRSDEITVAYTTRDGKQINRTFKTFIARIFQHEYDHLEGLVFLDRVENNKEIITDKEYLKIIDKTSKK